MAKSANAVPAVPAKPVTLSPLDAARLAVKAVLTTARKVETTDAAGKAVATDINSPDVWSEWGANDAVRETHGVAQLALARALLKDAPAPVWNAFSEFYRAGAASQGYAKPADLLTRCVYAPLKAEGISKPVSETSSNARKDAAGVTVAEAKKVQAEAMAKLSDADVAAEIAEGKSARIADLYAEMAKREKAKSKDAADKIKEQKAAARKSLTTAIDLMTPIQCVTLLGFATAILATEKNATALPQLCAKTLDAYDNANKKKSKK